MAQALHRFDMRLRLGSIRDTSASQRQAAAEAEVKKHTTTTPTVKTQVETKAEEEAIEKAKQAAEEAAKPRHYRIRPLSESKAIESGANFISETFLFMVAGGLILFESWRSRRKETSRRDGVEERLAELEQSQKTAVQALVALEKELLALKAKHGESTKSTPRILPRQIWETQPDVEEPQVEETWWTKATSYFSFGQNPPTTAPTTPATQTAQPTDTKQVGPPAAPAGQTQASATKSS